MTWRPDTDPGAAGNPRDCLCGLARPAPAGRAFSPLSERRPYAGRSSATGEGDGGSGVAPSAASQRRPYVAAHVGLMTRHVGVGIPTLNQSRAKATDRGAGPNGHGGYGPAVASRRSMTRIMDRSCTAETAAEAKGPRRVEAPHLPLSGGCRLAVHRKTRTARAGGDGRHRCTHPSAANCHGRRAYFAKDATRKRAVGSVPTAALDPWRATSSRRAAPARASLTGQDGPGPSSPRGAA